MDQEICADLVGAVCPVPIRDQQQIVLGHGSGGKLSAELSLVLGLDGSCSRIVRSISSMPPSSSSLRENGGAPVNNSYSRTPSE